MAVTTTTIAGTDSLSGSRITINDNFKTLENALNSVLSAFDIVSGRFDNSLYGSANDIITNGIVINGTALANSLTINDGNINLLLGDVKVGTTYGFYVGALLQLDKYSLGLTAAGGTYPSWDLRSPGGTSDSVGGIVLPHLTAAGFTAIASGDVAAGGTPANGTLVFCDYGGGTTNTPLKLYWEGGTAGPTWYTVPMIPNT